MKFKLSEVYSLVKALPKITDKEIPAGVAYRLFKLLKSCSEEMSVLEQARVKLVEKYAEEKGEGKELQVSDENKEKFQEEFTTLLNEEIEIKFTPIKIKEFGDISFSVNDIAPLEKIIKD